jgi:hypothetical protein
MAEKRNERYYKTKEALKKHDGVTTSRVLEEGYGTNSIWITSANIARPIMKPL